METEFHNDDQLSDAQKKDLHTALRYDSAKPVDIDAEMKRIMSMPHRNAGFKSARGKSAAMRRLAWIASGVAAALAMVIGWHGLNHDKPEPAVRLYTANPANVDIEMAVLDAGDATADNTASASIKNSRAVIVNDTVLDIRLVPANADNANEERVVNTPQSKSLTIILADATRVTLSAGSVLRFPLRFTGDARTVFLEGEAYFVVAKDPGHQFNVVTQNLTTTALGTEFYVRAFPNKESIVSLVGGKVRVEDTTDCESVLLEPGQDAVEYDGKLRVVDTDKRALQYWRDGYFYFQDCPLGDMMVDIGKWYNVNVEINDTSIIDMHLRFVAGRDEKLDDIVTRLNKFEYFDVKVNDNTLCIVGK